MFKTSSPLSRPNNSSFSSTVSSISICISSNGSIASMTPSFWCRKRTMNFVQQCARQLKDLVYECQKRRGPHDNTSHYRDAESILVQLLDASFTDEGRRLQISSGVVVDLAQLLVLDVIKWQSPNQLSTNFRHQIAKLLTNLTFGSTDCKKLLCLEENFVTSVCQLLTIPTLVRDYSDMIRNIAWQASREIGHYLLVTVQPLANASIKICSRPQTNTGNFSSSRSSNNSTSNDDKTLKSIYSALWNLALTSRSCCETMCKVEGFLYYLINWLNELDRHPVVIEQVVGLSKCLVEQIYNSPNPSLRADYVTGLMNLVAIQSAKPNISLIRNTLHALSLCIQYKKDIPTKNVFFKTNRFKHDLKQLLEKKELDQGSRDRIQTLLQHVYYCSGLLEGAVNSPRYAQSNFHSPSFAPTPTYGQTLAPSNRPNMPLTSLLSPHPSLRDRTFPRNQPPKTTCNITPTSQDSIPSSADSKLGFNARRHEDMKSSGYSETSMGSENYQQFMSHMQHKTEYAEPKKQAFIRNLNPTVNQHYVWPSPDSSNHSGLYENQRVIDNSASENCEASTSSQIQQQRHSSSPEPIKNFNETNKQNYYQNDEENYENEIDPKKSYYMGDEPNQYGSEMSLFCNARSQHPSLSSIMPPFFQNEQISPRSEILSPINEDDINASDSASQRGILIEKNNGSSNTTPRTTTTNNSIERQKNNDPINFQKLAINPEMYKNEGFNQTF